MNPDDLNGLTVGSITMTNNGYGVVTGSGSIMPIGAVGSSTSATVNVTRKSADAILDEWELSSYVIDHKVSEVEMLKLKEVKPDYADDIKENIAKNLARDISKKVTFTKRKAPDDDTHHFIGRVWCFTTDELKKLIEDARNA